MSGPVLIPTLKGPARILGTATPGQVPGDGQPFSDGTANRPLLDRELFVNQGDRTLCSLAANGQLFFIIDSAAVQAIAAAAAQNPTNLLAALNALPTSRPTAPGALWLNNGVPEITQLSS